MKSKIFKIHLANETRDFEESKLNKFLESVFVRQTFAAVVNNEYWSVIVFYEDSAAAIAAVIPAENVSAESKPSLPTEQTPPKIPPDNAPKVAEKPAPLILSPEQENKFNALKQWRNERAAQDGLPPYMIAPNDALMNIAAAEIKAPEDLLQIKGFGEKRAQKYGEEILRILDFIPQD